MRLDYLRDLALDSSQIANAKHTTRIPIPRGVPQPNTKDQSVIVTTHLYRIFPHLIIIKPKNQRFYGVFFLAQYAKAKEASPTTFIMANVRVAHLPQSNIISLIRRPIVPIISSIKAIKRVDSRIDVPPHI